MKRLICVIMLLTLLLCSCTGQPTETAAQNDTETVTETTEPVETEPEETAAVHDTALADGFKFSKMLSEMTTELSGESTFSTKTAEYSVAYESRFYGPQSMIDRDSHHMGDLFVAAKYATEYPQDEGYLYGEFNGDRFSDYVTYNDGELKIYQGKGKYARYGEEKLLCTAKFDIDGTLRATGDFNGDGFTDLLFVTEKKTAFIGYGSEDGFEPVSAGYLTAAEIYAKEDFHAGDMNGDGLTDIIAVKGFDTSAWIIKDGKAELYSAKTLNIKDEYNFFCVTDVNTDGFCDLIVYMEGVGLRSYYGRKDGQFGPYENEIGNKNLYPTWETSDPIKYMTPGDTNEDGVSDIVATMKYRNNKDWLVCSLTYPTEAPAYDYSTSILKKDDGTYILYNGGLYVDYNKDKYAPTDGDHVLVYTSDDGVRWHRNLDAPAFYLGGELGVSGEWWSGNTIEPEVICVDGTYYMYWQCENYTHLENGTLIGHDYIGVATSTDGLHFERKTDKPVIINEPEYSSFDHEEVLYYPDDPDGRPYWLFVRHVIRNTSERFCRIRSDSPYEFDYRKAERLSNFNGLGNQTGWLKLDNGETLFVRITIVERGGKTTPALIFSSDGLKWSAVAFEMAGVDKTNAPANTGKNIYFVGFSTINGTGEIERLEDGRYRFIYGGCTSETPVAPQIFYSNAGCGECIFSIK
ncbi:MAG: VCBS repeat-containing protein [Clostridia bacterium]|nr:VCBS repeat-containing protein [Clostridia bacterium]